MRAQGKLRRRFLSGILGMLLCHFPLLGASDMFMKIDTIEGEVMEKTHDREIEVLDWSWGMEQSGTTHVGAGGGAGQVHVQDLTFTKYVDKATPALMLRCCDGQRLQEAVLTVRRAGEVPLEYLKITLTDVIVASVSTGGSAGDDRLTEQVTLNFAKVWLEYLVQNPDGTGDPGGEMRWDIPANKEG